MIAIQIWSLNPYYTIQSLKKTQITLKGFLPKLQIFQGGVVLWQIMSFFPTIFQLVAGASFQHKKTIKTLWLGATRWCLTTPPV